jgi:hypothetical protein
VIAVSLAVFLVNVVVSLRRPRTAAADPWQGNTLEWAAARRADREAAAEQTAPGPEGATVAHVHPTIWPFAFSIAALALVVGAVVATRVLVPLGLAVFAAAAVGWFAEVRRAHRQ